MTGLLDLVHCGHGFTYGGNPTSHPGGTSFVRVQLDGLDNGAGNDLLVRQVRIKPSHFA